MRWFLSMFFTTIFLGIGGYGIYMIHQIVPAQLQEPSMILAKEVDTPLTETEYRNLKDVIQATQQKVVKIELYDGSIGSGFLYNEKGDVVTNAHVVAGEDEVLVVTADSNELTGKVIGISQDIDIALVRVDGLKDKQPLKVSEDKKVEIGDEVLALGSPLGLDQTVTTGIISGLDRDFELGPYRYEGIYQISAPIAPGNSGGPLVLQETGEVIGINSAGADIGVIGFSIPMSNVVHILDQWSDSPMLGGSHTDYENLNRSDIEAEMEAIYVFDYFYSSINVRDYVTAYSLLGSNWQSNLSYEDFQEGYVHTYSVSIDDRNAYINGDKIQVTAIITAEETNSGHITISKYKVNYTLGYENDQLKILSGKGEKLN